MGLVIDVLESLRGNVGINLRRLQAGVPEQLLHDAQDSPAFDHVGRRAMAQRVRADLPRPGAHGSALNDTAHLALVNALATRADKQRTSVACQLTASGSKPALNSMRRSIAEGHDPLLIALALSLIHISEPTRRS